MPTWNEINREIDGLQPETACDQVRQKYLKALEARVGRTVIAYYSGFLQKRTPDGRVHPECAISDLDMNGLMAVVHNVDRTRGLDLIIHTPGGGVEAARAIVEYLYKMFGPDIRVIVPHMAMSAGTMIACAGREILMGKHSCLGPTDPQVKGHPAMGVLGEVDRAIAEIKAEPLKQIVWQQVFAKYPPAFILDCERSVAGTRDMVGAWLAANMLAGEGAEGKAAQVMQHLMDYNGTTEHSHHFLIDKCVALGLNVSAIETDQDLQEDILSVHHSFVATFARTSTIKLIENAIGANWIVAG
nr:ATP-dependent Clp protease proteolytic subunit [uncultured Devosia sp.]